MMGYYIDRDQINNSSYEKLLLIFFHIALVDIYLP